jgi:hypothetical protein
MASEEQSNDMKSEEQSNDMKSEEQSNDMASEEQSNDMASEEQSNDMASEESNTLTDYNIYNDIPLNKHNYLNEVDLDNVSILSDRTVTFDFDIDQTESLFISDCSDSESMCNCSYNL